MSKTQNWILILSILTFPQTVSCSPPPTVQGSNETLKFRLNYSFFKFFSQNGHRVVDREIPKITIPNISLPFSTAVGSGVVVTSELVIQKFQTPNIDFSLSKTGISWSTSFGAAKLIGKWGASFTEFITVKDSGWLNVVASDIRMNISASATELDGQPQIEIGACEVDIIHMDVQIGGSVLSYLVNLFRGPLSSLVKSLIHSQACVAASGILLTEANRFLHSLPSHIDIGKNFYVDYYLTQNPTSFDEGVDIDLAADVVYGQSSCHPWKVMNWTDAGAHAGMVTLWVSKSIPNCLLESAHKNRLVKIVVSKNSQLVEPYLKTSCGIFSICIGKFFTKLRQNYPNQYVDLVFSTYLTPFLSMSESDGLELIMSFTVDFYINPYQEKSTEDTLARLIVDTSSDVRPYLNNSRISGDLQNCTIRVREQFSNIGDFSEIFLRTFSNILSVTAKEAVKKVLKVGIPIPSLDNVTLADSSTIEIFNDFMRANIDFKVE